MRKIIGFLLGAVIMLPQIALAAALPPTPDVTISGFTNTCPKCLYQGANLESVLKFNLTNTGLAQADIEQIAVHYTGTAISSELGLVSFYDDPNSTLLGTTTINFPTKTATLVGAPIISIPAGETREITVYVKVKAAAVIGRTAQFKVLTGDITFSGGNPVTLVNPYTGNLLQVCAPQVLAGPTVLTLMSPNGGEVLTKGETYTMSWNTVNAPYNSYVRNIELLKGGVFVQNIDVITTPRTLPGALLRPGQVVRWVVPNVVTGNNYKIRIHLYKGPSDSPTQIDVDASDANFRIE